MKLLSTSETLTREVHMPDRPHEGVTFSSTRFQSSSVTIAFSKWVEMGYPNEVVATISLPDQVPTEIVHPPVALTA